MGRVVSRRKIEMTWRCSACSNRNLGRFKECQQCGDPKDSSEKYEMPGSTSAAPTVRDPKLLKMAHAGANWQCHYCGSHQRAYDGTCAQCGASQGEGKTVHPGSAPGPVEVRVPSWKQDRRNAMLRTAGIVGGSVLGVVAIFCVIGFWATRPVDKDARVGAVHWEHSVHVERYSIHTKQGFIEDVPSDAFDRTSIGDRHHHDEQILDGYDTEHYTEDVPCGEDCYSTPESCSESCSPDGNGFASCTTTCSGGGQTCTTRYCSESRTRQVPRYRYEPVYAAYYSFKVWEWAHHRTVPARGDTVETTWPTDEEIALNQGLGEGERERSTRETSYEVRFEGLDDGQPDGDTHVYNPASSDELAAFVPGSQHRIRVHYDDRVEILTGEEE